MLNFIKKIQKILFISFPAILFFSYYPVITIGKSDVMNLEFSLPEIWLVLISIFSLPFLFQLFRFYGWKKLLLFSLIPIYFALSIIWSDNHLRAFLTAGIFTLIVYVGLNLIYLLKTDRTGKFRNTLVKVLLISSIIVSVFCWIQCVLDLVGVSREHTLLCSGCVSTSFGFPHPNGFAIEPQFMGNLLIAPALLSFYLLAVQKKTKRRIQIAAISAFLVITLFITLSRGAIYAFIIAFIIEQILLYKKHLSKIFFLKPIILLILSFIVSLTFQGLFAALSPTNDTFVSGITKSIHQLSLGKIDLRPQSVVNPSSNAQSPDHSKPSDQSTSSTDPFDSDSTKSNSNNTSTNASFSGYVAESTNVRLNLNSLAFETWTSSTQYMSIGAGLGSAGLAMHHYSPESIGPKEIVQNEYVSLLLEIGLIGCAIVMLVAIFLIKTASKSVNRSLLCPLFWSTIFGFALTLLFFSGLPNALHIYVFPLFFISLGGSKDNFVIK